MSSLLERLATKRAAWIDSLPSDAPWDDVIEMRWIVRAIADEIDAMPAEVVPSYAFARWLREETEYE